MSTLTATPEFMIPISAWVGALFVGLLTLFYVYVTWHYKFWQKQGVKCNRPWFPMGTIKNPFRVPMDIQDMEQYKKYGRVFGTYEGRIPSLIVAEPELLKQILVKDFHLFQNRRTFEVSKKDKFFTKFLSVMKGDEWKHHRNIMTPTFTTGKMKQMLILMEDCAKELAVKLQKYSDKNEPFEFTQGLASYILDVIARCVFGTKIDNLENQDNDFVKHSTTAFNSPPKLIFLIFLFPKLGKYLPSFMPQKTMDYFETLVTRVINARKQEKNPRKDFLQIMMEAQAESEKGNLSISDVHENSGDYPLTQDHIIANSMLFIIAGFETTSTTLSFALYNIAIHDEIQERLIKEIDDVLAEHGGDMNYEVIGEMQYLDMVIAETLRMYPPAVRLERACMEDCEVDEIKLMKGCIIGVPLYCIHYDEEFYPEPEKFDPERFTPENKNQRNPYTYLPFGYGPRNCIGMRFALMSMKIVLAYMLKEFRVKTCPTTDIPYIRKQKSSFLKPERMNLQLEKRTDCGHS